MQRDKSLLPFKGYDTLIQYQFEKLSKLFSKVYISAKKKNSSFEAEYIYDKTETISSPMLALQSILKQIDKQKVFIIPVDVPFIHTQTIKDLINKSKNYTATIAKDDISSHYLCGVYNKNILSLVEKLIENDIHKVRYLIKNSDSSLELEFFDKKQFLNLNTISDYNRAVSISKNYRLH